MTSNGEPAASSRSSGRESSPASPWRLLRSKSAPAKIQNEDPPEAAAGRDNFITRTIFAPILFLSFILSLAIVDRRRRLEDDRKLGLLTARRKLLYLSLFWRIPRTPDASYGGDGSGGSDYDYVRLRSESESFADRATRRVSASDGGELKRSRSREGEDDASRVETPTSTLVERRHEAKSLSAEAFSIQNRVMLGMGVFSMGFGLLCWLAYVKARELLLGLYLTPVTSTSVTLAALHIPTDYLAFGHEPEDAYDYDYDYSNYDYDTSSPSIYNALSGALYDLLPSLSFAMHVRTRSKNRLSGALDSLRERVGRSNDRLNPAQPYLSYHDICLWQEDVNCLESDWLTDNNIAFWEEYLEHEVLARSDPPPIGIMLLRPSMVFMLRFDPDLSTIRSALPPIAHATHIFLPINDNLNPNVAEGGSHWSLLVVSVADRAAFHYDSLGGANRIHARAVAEKVSAWIGVSLVFRELDEDTPMQTNMTDCGVHVCMNMRHLLVRRLLSTPEGREVNMSLRGKNSVARSGREEMLKIVRGLRRTAERSQSPAERGGRSPPRIE
ncbi:hypothetical protein Dda_5529 [Drechslerella dactyloides]|uniref:Ubiquitin-like protease family profile domain-containing protein n=1 Tax=Drechslerella dactyloides TaxID=74499 RepID=A0AAD6NIY5_DREDA|nr:hypothetical protein Dda_5529 [Drechslerella dactyloides]